MFVGADGVRWRGAPVWSGRVMFHVERARLASGSEGLRSSVRGDVLEGHRAGFSVFHVERSDPEV